MTRLFAVFAIWLSIAAQVDAEESPTLWYLEPAEEWVEAVPIGNGRLGGMVFGSTPKERVQLNEESLWAGEPIDASRQNSVGLEVQLVSCNSLKPTRMNRASR